MLEWYRLCCCAAGVARDLTLHYVYASLNQSALCLFISEPQSLELLASQKEHRDRRRHCWRWAVRKEPSWWMLQQIARFYPWAGGLRRRATGGSSRWRRQSHRSGATDRAQTGELEIHSMWTDELGGRPWAILLPWNGTGIGRGSLLRRGLAGSGGRSWSWKWRLGGRVRAEERDEIHFLFGSGRKTI
jgi:hypothetical protein